MTADRQARAEDVHGFALGLPHVTVVHGARGNVVYQVGGKSFVFFRTPRPDAVDAATGERLPDVIVFWVESEADKQALIQDETTPFFTTPHFDGHNSVLVQASRLGEIARQELAELVQEAWLAQASARRRVAWLAAHGTTPTSDPDPTDSRPRTLSRSRSNRGLHS
ncbi:MmcQ/YjbR family DNA-binding protein [Geodermatophilus sp. DSM 44513]|uniref:MmcQ/YjbR family DNA-binding protein n=1 Tax=Geodermatophilus sp. DSM 44513 TaxID=1528104 RepID=UPI001411C865|nr:MmcQ/YjbR family DNA-binding protein [Geodermatophilus sp. DSM 44513]WNV76524.1 MmcQ/YjbR family DNA-binding protein [Geodermatophilus sp. DSM 44513]